MLGRYVDFTLLTQKNRAVACLPQLKALNTTAIIKVVDAVTDSFDNFDVVIFAGNVASLKKQNELCRRVRFYFTTKKRPMLNSLLLTRVDFLGLYSVIVAAILLFLMLMVENPLQQ
jgi:hypothetical protein